MLINKLFYCSFKILKCSIFTLFFLYTLSCNNPNSSQSSSEPPVYSINKLNTGAFQSTPTGVAIYNNSKIMMGGSFYKYNEFGDSTISDEYNLVVIEDTSLTYKMIKIAGYANPVGGPYPITNLFSDHQSSLIGFSYVAGYFIIGEKAQTTFYPHGISGLINSIFTNDFKVVYVASTEGTLQKCNSTENSLLYSDNNFKIIQICKVNEEIVLLVQSKSTNLKEIWKYNLFTNSIRVRIQLNEFDSGSTQHLQVNLDNTLFFSGLGGFGTIDNNNRLNYVTKNYHVNSLRSINNQQTIFCTSNEIYYYNGSDIFLLYQHYIIGFEFVSIDLNSDHFVAVGSGPDWKIEENNNVTIIIGKKKG